MYRRENAKKINKIMTKAFASVTKMEERALKRSIINDLSITEIHTLAAIDMVGEKTMGEVAERLDISFSTLTTSINKLVVKNYVERYRASHDRRVVRIRLTEWGKKVVKAHSEFHEDMMGDMLSNFSDGEVDLIAKALERLDDYMDMQESKPLREATSGMLKNLKLGDYTLPYALIQGGMSIGFSKSGLASSVASEGGMGVISAVGLGIDEDDYNRNPVKANIRILKKETQKAMESIKKIPSKKRGILGVNIPAFTEGYSEYVREAVADGAQAIISGGTLPLAMPSICNDPKVLLIPIVSSPRAAKLIMRNWDIKQGRLPDAFIFENALAGGMLGYKNGQLLGATKKHYKIIEDIKKVIGDIPLIVAGGIATGKDAENAYRYGADGIQIASRFITTKECDAPLKVKQVYLNSHENDVTIIKDLHDRICRVLKAGIVDDESKKYDTTKGLIEAAKGNISKGIFFCGSKVYMQDKIDTVRDVFHEFYGVEPLQCAESEC